jgi:hypothetical protein
MKITEFRKLIREEVRKVIKEANVTMTGDYNNASFRKSSAFLKTPEGMKAVKIFKTLVAKDFDVSDLTKAIKACKFKSMKDFQAAAPAGGLEIDGLGNLDNEGTGDFEVLNDTYTDQGMAIAFFNNKFDSVG